MHAASTVPTALSPSAHSSPRSAVRACAPARWPTTCPRVSPPVRSRAAHERWTRTPRFSCVVCGGCYGLASLRQALKALDPQPVCCAHVTRSRSAASLEGLAQHCRGPPHLRHTDRDIWPSRQQAVAASLRTVRTTTPPPGSPSGDSCLCHVPPVGESCLCPLLDGTGLIDGVTIMLQR
eukprot:356009-Chlamydomonas_euryale.AAC.3